MGIPTYLTLKWSPVVTWLAFLSQAECSAPGLAMRVCPGMNGTDRHLVMEGCQSFQNEYTDVAEVVSQR